MQIVSLQSGTRRRERSEKIKEQERDRSLRCDPLVGRDKHGQTSKPHTSTPLVFTRDIKLFFAAFTLFMLSGL